MFIETSAKAGFNIKARRARSFASCLLLRGALSTGRASARPAQALFRKIASALPGMDSIDAEKQEARCPP